MTSIQRRVAVGLSGVLAALLGCQVFAAVPAVLSEDDARHLLVRTGFAPSPSEVRQLATADTRQAIDELLARARAARPQHTPPAWVSQAAPVAPGPLRTAQEQQAFRQQQFREGLELKTWWVREMVDSPTPLAERMTLFWHNHFATSQQKVVRSQAMWRQHQLLRSGALGSFRTLLHAVAKDPAMLVYLDGANSRREAPNENFAREVMELFTLGEASQGGGYTELDIREAARAFTGWSIDRDSFEYRWRPGLRDFGTKTVLGRTGRLDGDDVLDLLLEQPATARWLVGKLWRELVSPQPDPAELERLAARFRQTDYDVARLVQDLLLTDAFWAPENRGTLVKSPVELVVGTVRQFGFSVPDALPLALKSAQLGQNLLVPPNVKGWPGYTDWINASTLLERKRFTEQLFRAVERKADARPNMMAASADAAVAAPARAPEPAGEANRQLAQLIGREGVLRVAQSLTLVTLDAPAWLQTLGASVDREPLGEVRARLNQTVLGSTPTRDVPAGTVGLAYLRMLTLDPAYQLK